MKIDPSELGMVREIAKELGTKSAVVCNWTQRYDFPAPVVVVLSAGAVYHVPTVVRWAREQRLPRVPMAV